MRSVKVDEKPAKKWEDLTPRQRRKELAKTPRKLNSRAVEPNPFDMEEGIITIPLRRIED